MKRKLIITLVCIVILLACGYGGYRYWYDQNHVEIEGSSIPCDTVSLTLTGNTLPSLEVLQRLPQLSFLDVRSVPVSIAEYDRLCADFPNCEVRWQVPFQGRSIPTDTVELSLTSLTDADLEALSYLPALARIRAEGCTDYALLLELEKRFPKISLSYTIGLNGEVYTDQAAADVTSLTLQNADIEELAHVIPCFKQLKEVIFTGTVPDNDAIYELMCAYPEISFQWELELFGITTSNQVEHLDLSGIPMESTDVVEAYLKYFPKLTRVDMCDCGIPSAEMDPLSQRHPQIRFIWTIKIGMGTLRTDAIAFIPYKIGHTRHRPLYDEDCTELKYCIDLICLDMGHMKITDLSFLLYMPKMKYLIVADTPVTDFSPVGTLTELIYLEIFYTNFTQHEILLQLINLQDLNLGTTPTDDITELSQMTWLKRLWLPGTQLKSSQRRELREALPDTYIVTSAEHSTDKDWRKAKNYYDMRDLLGMFYMD